MASEVIGSAIRVASYILVFWLFVFGSVPIVEGRFYRCGVFLDLIGIASLLVVPKLASFIVLALLIGWKTQIPIYIEVALFAASAVVMSAPLPMPEQVMRLFKQLGYSTRYFDDFITALRNATPQQLRPLPLALDTHGIENTGPGMKRMPVENT